MKILPKVYKFSIWFTTDAGSQMLWQPYCVARNPENAYRTVKASMLELSEQLGVDGSTANVTVSVYSWIKELFILLIPRVSLDVGSSYTDLEQVRLPARRLSSLPEKMVKS